MQLQFNDISDNEIVAMDQNIISSDIVDSPSPPIPLLRLETQETQEMHNKQTQCIKNVKPKSKPRRFIKVFNGSEIRALNKCTYDILLDDGKELEEESEYEYEKQLTFTDLLERQHEELKDVIPDVSVAMSFLSLLTVSSDSYHKEKNHRNDHIEISLDRYRCDFDHSNRNNNDFFINVTRHSDYDHD